MRSKVVALLVKIRDALKHRNTVNRLAKEYGMPKSCIRQMLAIESGESTGDVIEVWETEES